MRIVISLLLLPFLFSCQSVNDNQIYGKYSPIQHKNTRDTITIYKNGTYSRVIYDKRNRKLLDYKSKYKLNNPSIKFNDFYLNLDKDLTVFPEDVKDIDMTYTTYFEKTENNIIICFGYHDGENCYKKVAE